MADKKSTGQPPVRQPSLAGQQQRADSAPDLPEFFRINAQYLIAPGASFENLYNDFTMLRDMGIDLLREVAQEADSQKCWASFHLLSQAGAVGEHLYRESEKSAPADSESPIKTVPPGSAPEQREASKKTLEDVRTILTSIIALCNNAVLSGCEVEGETVSGLACIGCDVIDGMVNEAKESGDE